MTTNPTLKYLTEYAIVACAQLDMTTHGGGEFLPVWELKTRAVADAVAAGADEKAIQIEGEERFFQHVRDCRNPNHKPVLAVDSPLGLEAALRELAVA